jgi:hypothetical protein
MTPEIHLARGKNKRTIGEVTELMAGGAELKSC